ILPLLSEYQRQFLVKNKQGMPIPNVKYRLTTSDGKVIEGVTDKEGLTERVFAKEANDVKLECLANNLYRRAFVLTNNQGTPLLGIKYKMTTDSGKTIEGETDE